MHTHIHTRACVRNDVYMQNKNKTKQMVLNLHSVFLSLSPVNLYPINLGVATLGIYHLL